MMVASQNEKGLLHLVCTLPSPKCFALPMRYSNQERGMHIKAITSPLLFTTSGRSWPELIQS